MCKSKSILSAGAGLLLCAAALGPVAALAAEPATHNAAEHKAEERTVLHEFNKLSRQGNVAMADIARARLAVFNGDLKMARELVAHAQQALKLAQNDHTAYVKAEADLKAPPGMPAPATPPDTHAIAWLPVDGSITLTDDYTAMPPQKINALKKANDQLKKGDQQGAMHMLKLADVNVVYTVALAPLEQTVKQTDVVAGLLAADKYYEASQELRRIEQSVRYEWQDYEGTPKPAKAADAKDAGAASKAK